jgi:hypothetical protein
MNGSETAYPQTFRDGVTAGLTKKEAVAIAALQAFLSNPNERGSLDTIAARAWETAEVACKRWKEDA